MTNQWSRQTVVQTKHSSTSSVRVRSLEHPLTTSVKRDPTAVCVSSPAQPPALSTRTHTCSEAHIMPLKETTRAQSDAPQPRTIQHGRPRSPHRVVQPSCARLRPRGPCDVVSGTVWRFRSPPTTRRCKHLSWAVPHRLTVRPVASRAALWARRPHSRAVSDECLSSASARAPPAVSPTTTTTTQHTHSLARPQPQPLPQVAPPAGCASRWLRLNAGCASS
mmetsp:Transcript_2995/g.8984  ORF Transcript_2995/g.8984 Transcript_2995/m.8984 type:complete len:221 (-) Transcript_2995:942-1604(-)